MPSCKGEEGEEGTSDGGSSLSSQNGLSTVGVEGVEGLALRAVSRVIGIDPAPFLVEEAQRQLLQERQYLYQEFSLQMHGKNRKMLKGYRH